MATYALDEEGQIHLRFVLRDGSLRQAHGSVPPGLVTGTSESLRRVRFRRLMIGVLMTYPACGVLGFAVGYHVGTPQDQHSRVAHGFIGLVVGIFAVAVLIHGCVVVLGTSRGLRASGRSEP